MTFPPTIQNEIELLQWMTRPSPALLKAIPRIKSPLLILGAGGKMGPSLSLLARRAADAAGHALDIIAVSRFSDPQIRIWLDHQQITTISADLMDPTAFQQLPECENLIYMIGQKFGTSQNPAKTWAINTLPPAYCVQRYPQARIVALSSGNVYPFVRVDGEGSRESDPLTPTGEYANSCIARERIFEYWSAKQQTSIILLRLSYALDLRYGVLVDIARKIFQGQPLDVSMGKVNCIWQGDANDMILRSLELAGQPPAIINLTGTEWFSLRDLAHRFGEYFNCEPEFSGEESGTALISNTEFMVAKLGAPHTPVESLLRPTAEWIRSGGRLLDKPTHFEVRDGAY